MTTISPTDDAATVARILRLLLAEFPPANARERATARRIEGAVVALEVVASQPGTP